MSVAGFVMLVLSTEPEHAPTLQSFYYQSNIQRYHRNTHTHRSQVRGAPIASVTLTNGSITKGSEAISTAVVWRRDDCNISIYSGECRCMLIKLDLPSATRLKWDEKITFMFGVGSSEV